MTQPDLSRTSTNAIDSKSGARKRGARTGAVLVLLSSLGMCAGCNNTATPPPAAGGNQVAGEGTATDAQAEQTNAGTATDAQAQQMKRRPKKPKVDPYADVHDPMKLLAAWQERLVEDKYYLHEQKGVFYLDQLVFRYTWAFDDNGAVLTVAERQGPNGEVITAGRNIIYLFVEEVEIDWGAAPEFIRNKDGAAGDKAVKSLKQKFIDVALAKAKESTEAVDRTIGFERDDPAAQQSAAYRVLLGSGAEVEGETVTGNLFVFRGTAKLYEDKRVEAKLYVTARKDAGGDAAVGEPASETGAQ